MDTLLLTAIGVGGSTLIGSLLGYFVKHVSHRVNDAIIGLCAGVMLAAAVLGLLVPAFDLSPDWSDMVLPCLGVVGGVLLLNVLDHITPHLHNLTGIEQETHPNNRQLDRVLLFVMAIALHKFPEGLAAGVGFSGGPAAGASHV
ncbi:MAG: ZIP family metal transporter, partial [Bacteroidaceae bacterium]|nr:ZIP family metal transporter [Bacteroidaceae bacterium]